MDTEKLKQKILDLAIRGKLVPQDSNNESAEELIKKIQEEKAKLVKEGKIKASKEESIIFKGSDNCYYEKIGNEIKNISDEIPFEIPENWSWIRLNELGLYRKGPFGSSLTKSMFVSEQTIGRIKVYEQRNAIQKNAHIGNYFISKEKFDTMQGFIVEPGDIIVSCAGTIGEIYILPDNSEIGIINQALMRIRLYYKGIEEYFVLYFDSILKKEANEKGMGSTIKNIPPFDILKKMLLPLPPLNEIQRILEKISFIINEINEINTNYDDISKLVIKIKSKILDNFFGEDSSYKSYYENEYFLGDLLPYEQPALYIVKSTNYDDKYDTPVLTPGKSFILGYTNEKEGVYHVNNSKVIIFDDFTTASRIIDFDFKVKSSAMKILKSSDETKFNIDYLFFLLQSLYVNNDTHKRYWISEFATKKVKVHTFEEQLKIVKNINEFYDILDSIL